MGNKMIRVYKIFNGKLESAEGRETPKMVIFEERESIAGYRNRVPKEELYFSVEEAIQGEKNKLKESRSMYKELIVKINNAYSRVCSLEERLRLSGNTRNSEV